MIELFAYLFLALFVSFLCSIMETVLLSTPKPFLVVKYKNGNTWANTFMELKDNIDKPLSAILSLNTVAHTVGAAGVGAQAVKIFGDASFGVVSAILTILILVLTEIIPKTIGARYWRKLAKSTSFIIRIMIIITYPLVSITSIISKAFSKGPKEQTISREEIAALASIGKEEGVFTKNEHRIIQNLLKLKNVKVREIMTPRIVVVVSSEELSLEEFLNNKHYLKFSRIPIFYETDENITGYVFRQTVFEKLAENHQELKLKDLKRTIHIVPNSIALFTLWEQLLEKKEHIALIINEYGGFDGIVTMEDIIETILGLEIIDEKDTIPDMQEYAKERWKERQAKYNLLESFDKQSDKNNNE